MTPKWEPADEVEVPADGAEHVVEIDPNAEDGKRITLDPDGIWDGI